MPDVGALYRIRGPSTPPQIARGIFFLMFFSFGMPVAKVIALQQLEGWQYKAGLYWLVPVA